jgi:hypothetical protein
MKKSFIIKAKIWRWPGNGGWHFVTLDKKISAQIRGVYTRGFVPVVLRWARASGTHRFSRICQIKRLVKM